MPQDALAGKHTHPQGQMTGTPKAAQRYEAHRQGLWASTVEVLSGQRRQKGLHREVRREVGAQRDVISEARGEMSSC